MEQTSPRLEYSWQEIDFEIEKELLDRMGKNKSLSLSIV